MRHRTPSCQGSSRDAVRVGADGAGRERFAVVASRGVATRGESVNANGGRGVQMMMGVGRKRRNFELGGGPEPRSPTRFAPDETFVMTLRPQIRPIASEHSLNATGGAAFK
jgi:hypothetical protein